MDEKVAVEGAAAGLYVAALFESGRPEHRGLNTARLARDARAAGSSLVARGRLLRARLSIPRPVRFTTITFHRPVDNGAGAGRRRPRGRGGAAGAAAGLVAASSKPRPRRLAAA